MLIYSVYIREGPFSLQIFLIENIYGFSKAPRELSVIRRGEKCTCIESDGIKME